MTFVRWTIFFCERGGHAHPYNRFEKNRKNRSNRKKPIGSNRFDYCRKGKCQADPSAGKKNALNAVHKLLREVNNAQVEFALFRGCLSYNKSTICCAPV